MLSLTACGTQGAVPKIAAPSVYEQQKAAQRSGLPRPEAPAEDNRVGQVAPGVRVTRADGTLSSLSDSLPRNLSAQNVEDKSTPIVLVHGLAGWGKGEFLGLNYWGGTFDIAADLRSQGYTVFTVSVGPISSSWDRASEVYAQIKGGCVDYGEAHSAHAGHQRTDAAKCYTGFYPQWNAAHPVNIIAHSMGGQTSRMLVALLERGSSADAQGENLFTGGRAGWVKNLMTIATPNTGSPAADQIVSAVPMFKDMIWSLGALAGSSEKNLIYDFDLGQWGMRRRAGESLEAYNKRVFDPASPVWKSDDQAAYTLSVEGANRENQWVGRSPHTRYFSWAASDSYAGALSGWHYPNPAMFPLLMTTAYPYLPPLSQGLGNLTGRSPQGTFAYTPAWWENDGLVPVYLQHAPLGQTSVAYTGQATQPGEWYRLGKLNGYDHLDVVGLFTLNEFRDFYRDQAAFLSRLP